MKPARVVTRRGAQRNFRRGVWKMRPEKGRFESLYG
jgi:hypothetical protein